MLNVSQLTNLRLAKLQTAVTDWEQMTGKLRALATGGGGGVVGEGISAADLKARAEAADWRGDNATVTKSFVTKTASEFNDVVTEAQSVHSVLRDALAALKRHQEDLRTTIDRWEKKNVYINEQGTATSAVPSGAAAGNAKIAAPTQEDVDRAAAEVAKILEAADDTDQVAARALRKLAQNKYDFGKTSYQGLDDAGRKQAIEDADLAVKLASKGAELTDAELKRFNEIVKLQSDNPVFAERFATKMGPEGTLQFWRGLADPGHGDTPTGDRAKILATVQDNLGLTLATASRLDTPAMQDWKDGVIAAGDDRIKHPGIMSAPYGYQVMSSLMTKGTWDKAFLNSYGTSLIDFERDNSRLGADWLWDNPGHPAQLNYPPGSTKPDNDPVAGFLEALGHNPEASLEFFNDSNGRSSDDHEILSNWDYLVDKDNKDGREWPVDEDGKTTGYTNLGHALESATLGYAYDDKNPGIPPTDTEAQKTARDERTDLMERVVDHYKTTDTIDKQDGIRDSLANMAAGHIDSLNYSTANWGGSGELSGRDDRFGADRNRLHDFGSTEGENFLKALASDEGSYETVSTAQQIYGSSVMTAQGDDVADAKRVGLHGIKMHGLLDEARFESIGKEFAEVKEDRNRELEKQGAWRDFAAGAVIGGAAGVGAAVVIPTGAAAAIAVPLAFETVGGAAETQFATQTMDWLKDREFDNTDEAIEGIGKARQTGENNAMTPLLNYAQAHGMSPDDVWDLSQEAESQYRTGGGRTDTDNTRGW
ncbi:hypothetical protein ACFXKF_03710 [Streptomyces scopuliridis]|uniref:hypothetical protein n=1 Tax=Streptomyces scopuliridis TaxID=452529 RepID=UPI0036C1DABD